MMTTPKARLYAGTAFVLIAALMNGIDAGTAAMHASLFVLGVLLIVVSFAPEEGL